MNRSDMVRGVLRVQQAVGLTPSEFRATLVFAGLLFLGVLGRQWLERPPDYDEATYSALQAAFSARASEVAAADTGDVARSDSLAVPMGERPLSDSTAGASTGSGARVERPGPTAFPIDLNRADADDLMRLPRIGPALAGRILAYRRDNGPFRFVDDLVLVRGIGERTIEHLRSLVTVGPEVGSDSTRTGS